MPLIWPLALPVLIIQDFCSNEFGHLHTALDLTAATSEGASVDPGGMTIVAVQDGTVSFVGNRGDGYGNTVEMTHSTDNLISKYSHMRCGSFLVTQGQEGVMQGTPLGLVGGLDACRGTSYGNHLHFALARLSDVVSYLWENSSSPGGFDPCQVMPNPGGVWYDTNSRKGPNIDLSGISVAQCAQCPQVAPPEEVLLINATFKAVSKIEYSVTTSQQGDVSKDCIAAPQPQNKPGVNHIVSISLENPTGVPMSRSVVITLPLPEYVAAVAAATAPIQSPTTVQSLQDVLDAWLGMGTAIVTSPITGANALEDLFD